MKVALFIDIFTLFVEARLCDEFVPRERDLYRHEKVLLKCKNAAIISFAKFNRILNSSSVVRPLSGEVKDFSEEVLDCFRRGSKKK